jgi:ubiquinone/menaquinone biosynthesis C-methylase UbiE
MSSSGARSARATPDFGPLAETYDRLRPQDDNWWELMELLAEAGDLAGRRVLDVGCGTGALARALAERGARVWGVDPSEEMLTVARSQVRRGVGLKAGRAEALPFKDAWFERAVLRLVVHLVDRCRALPELARVLAPGGRVVVATFDPSHFAGFWLNRFLPSLERIDRERYPEPRVLGDELEAAGFHGVRHELLIQTQALPRAEALARIRGRYISTLQLVPRDELASGTERAEAELPELVPVELRWAVVAADRP